VIILQNGAVLRSGRNPFEVWLLAACIITGAAGFITTQAVSGAVARTVPHWAGALWYAALFVGASISFVGIMLHGLKSLLVERVGLLLMATFGVVYAGAVIAVAGLNGLFPATFVAGFAAANISRFVQIGRDLKKATALMEELRPRG
jgi:hypothetical protein